MSPVQRIGISADSRIALMMFAIDEGSGLKKGSSVPTLPQTNKRLAIIRKMEPRLIDYTSPHDLHIRRT